MNIHKQNKDKIKPNTKIRVLSPEHSKYVQEIAFEAGFRWPLGISLETKHEDKKILYFNSDSVIQYSDDDGNFMSPRVEEIFIDLPDDIKGKIANPLQTQVGGSHYKDLAIQPVEYIHANGIGFLEGSVIKYVSRWKNKNGIKDLEKAKHFIELLIELEGEK